ncbi:MAG: response regulator, partial [uncultured bacterium]
GSPATGALASGDPPEAIFDLKVIESLKKLQVPGKPDIIGQLFDIYLSETSAKIDSLKKAIAEKNQESIRHIAHNLKSSTANVGGARLSVIFKSLEIRAKNNEIDGLEIFIDLIETNYGLLNEKLAQFRENKELS